MIYAYDDINNWGEKICNAVESFGENAKLFKNPYDVPDEIGNIVFIHMMHLPVHERLITKHAAEVLGNYKNITMIPSLKECRLYDDKVEQYLSFGSWMPDTELFTQADDAMCYLVDDPPRGYPFVSKSREGAGASNVRIIRDGMAAVSEINYAFNDGIPIYGGNIQHGYLLWQEFVPNLEINWRVFIMAKRYAIVTKRWNEAGKQQVNDNGEIHQVNELTEDIEELIDFAYRFVEEKDFGWCAIDIVEGEHCAYVLETSTGFPFWWMEKGGQIFERFDDCWSASGYRADQVFSVLAKLIIEGQKNEKTIITLDL